MSVHNILFDNDCVLDCATDGVSRDLFIERRVRGAADENTEAPLCKRGFLAVGRHRI